MVPSTITYASVASKGTARIASMIATLNDLEGKLGDPECMNTQSQRTEQIMGDSIPPIYCAM